MARPLLLDLFCGAGGAAMGYYRAGFDVIGVDINPQPHYPFSFFQADALTFPLDGFDAVHASPPCQAYSITKHSHSKEHPELIEPTRERLVGSGLPYVIENVVGAPLLLPFTLCGTGFDLRATDLDGTELYLRRHRLFESNVFFMGVPECRCKEAKAAGLMCGGVYGGGPSNRSKGNWKGYGCRRGGYTPPGSVRQILMGVDWMTQSELCQSIPPAYTEWIGLTLLAVASGRLVA